MGEYAKHNVVVVVSRPQQSSGKVERLIFPVKFADAVAKVYSADSASCASTEQNNATKKK